MPFNCDRFMTFNQIPSVEKPLLINIHIINIHNDVDPPVQLIFASPAAVPSSSTCSTNVIILGQDLSEMWLFLDKSFHKCDYSWTRDCFVEHVALPITRPPVIHQCHQSLKIKYDNKNVWDYFLMMMHVKGVKLCYKLLWNPHQAWRTLLKWKEYYAI